MKIYDTHAHLDQLEDLNGAIERAKAANVAGIVALSMDLESCRKNIQIRERYREPKIFLGLGMHPSEAKPQDLDAILKLIDDNAEKICAVGEIGLDFWYKWVRKDEDKKNEQRLVYRRLLQAAKELDKPAVIHSRGAWKECLETALEAGITKAEFHWYSGPIDVLKEILKAGYYVSTSPSVAYSPQSREAMTHAPIERTLIETDSPVHYNNQLTGESFTSEPKDVLKTLEAYAALRGLDVQDALAVLNRNAEEFFNLH